MTQRSVSEYGILGTSLTIYFLAPVSGKKSRAIVIIIIQPTAAASVGPKLPAGRCCSVRRRAASCGPVRAHAASSVACLRRACPRHVIHFAVRVTRCLCAHTCLRVPYLPHTSTPTHHSVSHRAFVYRPRLCQLEIANGAVQVHPGQGQ